MLLGVLGTFSKKEYAEFGKLVRSPLYVAGRNLYPLYSLLGKYHPDFESPVAEENLTKEKIFEKLYPGTGYNEKKSDTILRRLFSDLNKQAEEYLLLLALRSNTLKREYFLTEELVTRNLDANYKKHIRKIDELLKTLKISENYFKQMAEAENLKYNYNFSIKDHQELVANNVIKKGEYNIISSIQVLAEAMQDARINHNLFNSPYKETMIYEFAEKINYNSFIEYLNKEPGAYGEITEAMCYRLLNILNPGNKELIYKYRDMVIKYLDRYSKDMQNDQLLGIHSMMLRAGMPREGFEIIRFILEKGLYQLDKTKPFPLIPYRNLIKGAYNYNEYNWAEGFIKSYHKELSPEYRKDMTHYGRAYMHWNNGNYESVPEECSKIESQNASIVKEIKMLTLMAYYETGAFEPAFFLIESLKVFSKQNKKINPEVDISLRGFVKMTKMLLKYRLGESRLPLEKITAELDKINNIYNIEWLRKKAKELKSGAN